MSYILKTPALKTYVLAAPKRATGGCLIGSKLEAMARLTFATDEQARQWVKSIRESQKSAGMKPYALLKAYPVAIQAESN
jgi:hypothetical protein